MKINISFQLLCPLVIFVIGSDSSSVVDTTTTTTASSEEEQEECVMTTTTDGNGATTINDDECSIINNTSETGVGTTTTNSNNHYNTTSSTQQRRIELLERATSIARSKYTNDTPLDEKMDLLELTMMELLDEMMIITPPICRIGTMMTGGLPSPPIGRMLMGNDPRLPVMPEKPTLIDFFKYRLLHDKRGSNHLLQSGKLAMEKGLSETIILACLLHDFAVVGYIRSDHGYYTAQMMEPYVSEEITWAIRCHQSLRFISAPEYDFIYPTSYKKAFGEDYEVPIHIQKEIEFCKQHKYYDSAMQVVINDYYSFDPNKIVLIEEFDGIIQRHFKQPQEGLGFDGSSVAHMWRTIIWPNNFL